MKVLICGGRDYTDWEVFQEKMNMLELEITEIAHGDARGADGLADDYAWLHRIPCKKFPADWKTHGKAAGPIRNAEMLKYFKPDVVVAFPGGRGTGDMIQRAKAAGVRVIEAIKEEEQNKINQQLDKVFGAQEMKHTTPINPEWTNTEPVSWEKS